MRMPKHSDEAKAQFRALVAESPGVEVKPTFGSVGAFVQGNMFAGLFGTDIGVKLDEAGLGELRGIEGSGPFGPPERPMGGYVSIPAACSDDETAAWIDRARAHGATFPAEAGTK